MTRPRDIVSGFRGAAIIGFFQLARGFWRSERRVLAIGLSLAIMRRQMAIAVVGNANGGRMDDGETIPPRR